MQSVISVPIATSQFLELAEFLKANKDPRDPVDMIGVAIDYWLSNAEWKPDDLLQKPIKNSSGYIWKEVFLPHGTEVRMTYKGNTYRAFVDHDEFVYNGKPMSPALMVNTVSGTSRNAWRDLWVKRPHDREWVAAESLRSSAGME